jgi:hypothetical protein
MIGLLARRLALDRGTGSVGGSGATMIGLLARRLALDRGTGSVGGSGATMIGLAATRTVLVTPTAARTAKRTIDLIEFMERSLLKEKIRTRW